MKAWKNLRHLPRPLWFLCLTTLVNRLGTMVLPFLAIYLTKQLGFSFARAGLVMAIYGAVALIVGPIAGRLVDKWGAGQVMEKSLILSGIVLLCYPLVHTFPSIIVVTVLLSLTTEVFRPANMTAVAELAPPEHRKSAFALMRLAINLGMSVGPALGGFLAQKSFNSIFIVDGVTTILASLLLIITSFRKNFLDPKNPPLAESQVRSGIANLLGEALTHPRFLYFLLAILPVVIVFFQSQSTMAFYLVQNLHFSESVYGLLFTVNTVMIIFLEIPLTAAISHWSYHKSFAIGSALFGLGFGALAITLVQNIWFLGFTVALWTFGEMILFPSMSAYVSDVAPPSKRGEYMGIFSMSFSLAFMLGPWLGALVFQNFGSKVLWIGTLVLGLLSAGLLRKVYVPGTNLSASSS